jgi:molecular chaperone GrpE
MPKRFPNGESDTPETRSGTGTGQDGTEAPVILGEKEAAAAELSEIDKLKAELAAKDAEIAELKDKYLRALADSDNVRKRLRQQADETTRIQRENLIRELLAIVDNLERAVSAARSGASGKTLLEGVELVLRSMLEFLKAQGVSPLSAVGQPFDPQLHEAVDHVESSVHPPNTVVDEFHRGYLIGDRTLRTARVSVAKGAGDEGQGRGGEHRDRERSDD